MISKIQISLLWFVLPLEWSQLALADAIDLVHKDSHAATVGRDVRPIMPMEGTAWVDEEGVRRNPTTRLVVMQLISHRRVIDPLP
jgi:hypothetical protein